MDRKTELTEVAARIARELPKPTKSIRSLRYRGDDRAVPLSALTENDRSAVRSLYTLLSAFEARARELLEGHVERAAELAAELDTGSLIAAARALGSGRESSSEEVRRALHDVRGGALTSLLVELRRAERGEQNVKALHVLVSDHLKLMRNALLELDDARREADTAPRAHFAERLTESLEHVTGEGGAVRVAVQREFSGAITMSCVELGALDRASLNLVNNAVRHSASDHVGVLLLPAATEPDPDLRIVVANTVDDAQARVLQERFGVQLSRLFLESFSTTGSGAGMMICVDFVASAYGLARSEQAVRAGLVGARLEGSAFVAWLHWPAVA